MATIVPTHLQIPLEIGASDPWDAVARAASGWAEGSAVSLRDAVVLLPFAQLLAPARRAFAQRGGGWLPRIETTQTLARAMGPAEAATPGQLGFDAGADRLAAAQLLRAQPAGAGWAREQPRRFERAVGALVETAQALARAAAAQRPDRRAAWWERARTALAPLAGPGGRERALARLALEWAALAPAPASDRLFGLRPAAWIVVTAGGTDPLVDALLAAADVPCLRLDADAGVHAVPAVVPTLASCDDFEHEAQAAAAQVLVHLQRGQTPVALIGQDRLLVRRVRALLERQRVPLRDETGWTLSTTRAAAQVMLLLRAAAPRAGSDALFEWLKVLPGWPGRADFAGALRALERLCRRRRLTRIDALAAVLEENEREAEPGAALGRAALDVLAALRGSRQPATLWLERLRASLAACGAWGALAADEAGRAVLAALRLERVDAAESGPALSADEFAAWVDAVFEASSYVPGLAEGGDALVVVTPLARAMLRPFGAVVCPGADERHLGARPAPHALLSDATLRALGLPDAAQRQQHDALAFAHLLRLPHLTLLRRRLDAGDPLADSPLVERLRLALAERREKLGAWTDPRTILAGVPSPVQRPAPSAAALLPAALSASAAEALRECPYRFFARHLLKLREDDELDDEIEKRDYGTWLHAVLHAFHAGRDAPAGRAVEQARLHALGTELQTRHGLADEAFLPFAASFAAFVPRYVAWLHRRDAAGAVWTAGELDCRVAPAELGGCELHGVIDRIDTVAHGGALELIDYKTGSKESLERRVRDPQEDTQLAFYAALHAPQAGGLPLRAFYLALDSRSGLDEPIEHRQVERSAARLVVGLGADLARLRAGAGLPALGEGVTCDYCEARGLCRRDHWPEGGEA